MTTIQMKTGDTKPLRITLGVSLANKRAYLSLRRDADKVVVVDRMQCDVEDATKGTVKYSWRNGETAVGGNYKAEVSVVDAGLVETYPPAGTFKVVMEKALGSAEIESLNIEPKDLQVAVGQTIGAALQAFLTLGTNPPEWVTDQVIWSSSVNPPLLSVDNAGAVTGLAAGTATVTAKLGNATAQVDVVVTP